MAKLTLILDSQPAPVKNKPKHNISTELQKHIKTIPTLAQLQVTIIAILRPKLSAMYENTIYPKNIPTNKANFQFIILPSY